jgi:PAS domain-containing protein/DNA-binding CsgD family transcriptional regulator
MPGVSRTGGAFAMARGDLLATIEAIHAAGLDDACWPRALAAMREVVGGVGATFEVIDKSRSAHSAFHSVGIPPARQIEYADYYLAISPRVRTGLLTPTGHVSWDYQIIGEAAMRRDPFYADFLPQNGLRYFVAGTIRQTEEEFAVFGIQRSAKQGHVGKREIALMRQLVPHVQQAFDVARRLKNTGETHDVLERTLDCLADGVAVLRSDGTVIYANESFQAIARRSDGISIRKNAIEFTDSEARTKYKAAVAAVLKLRAGESDSPAGNDFMAARSVSGQSYLISIRPLLGVAARKQPSTALAIVFVRDPHARRVAATITLRDLFGLTEAEAGLAQALQSGVALSDYAGSRALSLNTVYTHLRRLREKTGSSRMAELIHKLNGLRLPLRAD